MAEPYFILKHKLEELGYNSVLPIEAVPLVECILADLLQTTRSLQHYMDLSKEALMQRDSLMMEAEPYKCDNAKLIQENNRMHQELIHSKEENMRLLKENRRKIKSLSEELTKKDSMITKLQHDIRDLSLRGLCAGTQSTRNKSKRKDDEGKLGVCLCNERHSGNNETEISDLTKIVQLLEEKNESYYDEIVVLKSQVEHRDNEILRLNMLLEGGRPLPALNKDFCNHSDGKVQSLLKELQEIEVANNNLKTEITKGLEKQHEAMLRALNLAEKNKALQEEVQKVDLLALKVEEDCNKKIAAMMNEGKSLQAKIEELTQKNAELERDLSRCNSKKGSPKMMNMEESLNRALKDNDTSHQQIKDLIDLNKCLQEKIVALSQISKTNEVCDKYMEHPNKQKCPTKDELQLLLENERKKYELNLRDMQDKISETLRIYNTTIGKGKSRNSPSPSFNSYDNTFVRELHTKLCESEQKILMLKNENDELKTKMITQEGNSKQNYKDVIHHLNVENAELSKENIHLSQKLSQFQNFNSNKISDRGDYYTKDINKKLQEKVDELSREVELLTKDKKEYHMRYKEAIDLVDKLKRDLVHKQKQVEQLEEENCSYKMTNRTGKASVEHLKDEINYLRDQIKKMQTDVIKEKSLSSQIKNIQLETERSSNELQNELLCVQKKFSLSKDTIESLEKKCKELQSEIMALRNDKANLMDSIRQIDQERDKLVLELDSKTENISVLEHKINAQLFTINQLENGNTELKRILNAKKVSEHKLADHESQIIFLNGEILRLTQQYDTAVMENKHLQNSLADANATMKITRIEYEKSKQEVGVLKQQLQQYVAEIRRIEEMLSHKEAERSDMLEQFASLSVEANILENTNHSLESESASKSLQLQGYINKIQSSEAQLLEKDNVIDSQAARIAAMTCKISTLENEVKLITEEKAIMEQNISYLKQMCNNLQSEHTNTMKNMGESDSELKLYENRIKTLSNAKANLEVENDEIRERVITTEKLLSNARKEIVELKLALQDATSETKSLQENVNRLTRRETHVREHSLPKEDFELPLMLDEIHEVSHEEDEGSSNYHTERKRFTKYTHSGTL